MYTHQIELIFNARLSVSNPLSRRCLCTQHPGCWHLGLPSGWCLVHSELSMAMAVAACQRAVTELPPPGRERTSSGIRAKKCGWAGKEAHTHKHTHTHANASTHTHTAHTQFMSLWQPPAGCRRRKAPSAKRGSRSVGCHSLPLTHTYPFLTYRQTLFPAILPTLFHKNLPTHTHTFKCEHTHTTHTQIKSLWQPPAGCRRCRALSAQRGSHSVGCHQTALLLPTRTHTCF